MKPNPCRKDCPKRSSSCHGTCKEYKDWKEEQAVAKEKARQDSLGYPRSYGQWTKTPDGYWRNKEIKRRR